MTMSLAVNVSMFTLTVVTLTLGALHYAGRPYAVAAVTIAVSVPIAVTPDQECEGEQGEGGQHQRVHGEGET